MIVVSLYDVLGAAPDADQETLRRAFVAKARQFHPDRHVGAEAATRVQAEFRMREVTEAWAVLGDPNRRQHYDLGLGDPIARGNRTGRADSTPPGASGPHQRGRDGTAGASSDRSPGGARASAPRAASGASSRPSSGAATSEGRHWRSYASPGSGAVSSKSPVEQLALFAPVLLLFAAGLLGLFGAIIGWTPFYGLALVCVFAAAAGFFILPIWAMTRGRNARVRRGPKRSY